jgi:hypothetical protein
MRKLVVAALVAASLFVAAPAQAHTTPKAFRLVKSIASANLYENGYVSGWYNSHVRKSGYCKIKTRVHIQAWQDGKLIGGREFTTVACRRNWNKHYFHFQTHGEYKAWNLRFAHVHILKVVRGGPYTC